MDGDGDSEKTGWTEAQAEQGTITIITDPIGGGTDTPTTPLRSKSGDAFLAVDKNNNGTIDDVTELFGNSSETGFEELAEYDSNEDGVINWLVA